MDKIGISCVAALLSFLLFFRLTRSIAIAALCALLGIAILALFFSFFRPKAPKNRLSKRNFVRYVLLNGSSVLKKMIKKAFEGTYTVSNAEEQTLLIGEKRILLYYAYKFGSLSEEDVAKSYRIAQKHDCEEIYALTNHLDRKAIAVTEYIPQKVNVIGASALYKYLLKKDLIPPKDAMKKKGGKVLHLLKTAINAGNAKYYILAGLSTSLLALFTPVTTYYIVFAFINLALAIACVLFSEKSEGENRLFKQ